MVLPSQDSAGGVLVLDLRTPVLPSLEAYLRLKKAGRVTRTILVAADAGNDRRAGSPAAWLLIKPFDPSELLRAIDAMTRDKQP